MGQTGGEVTEAGQISRGYRDNPERRVAEKSRGFRAGLLQGGQLGEIHRGGRGKRVHGRNRERRRRQNGRRMGESTSYHVL